MRLLYSLILTNSLFMLLSWLKLFYEQWEEIFIISLTNTSQNSSFRESQGLPWCNHFPILSLLPMKRMQIWVAGRKAEILCQTWTRICILCIKMQSGWKTAHALKAERYSEDGDWKPCTSYSGLTAQKAKLLLGCTKSSRPAGRGTEFYLSTFYEIPPGVLLPDLGPPI